MTRTIHVIAVALVVDVMAALIGWHLVAAKVAHVWSQFVERDTTGRQHPYRDPLRTTIIQPRLRLLVRAVAMANGAIVPGAASCVSFVSAYALTRGKLILGVTALCLGAIGIVLAWRAYQFVTCGPDVLLAIRWRVSRCALLSLVAHGAVVLTLVAVAMGVLDNLEYEIHLPGRSGGFMTLGNLRQASEDSLLKCIGHILLAEWRVLASVALVHACGGLLQAVLVVALVMAAHAGVPESRSRFFWGLLPALLAAMGILAGVAVKIKSMPNDFAANAYQLAHRKCSLPPLPRGASQLTGDLYDDGWTSRVHVQFGTLDMASYKRALRTAWYDGGEKRPGVIEDSFTPLEWRGDVEVFDLSRSEARNALGTTCKVSFKPESGFVSIHMATSD